MESDLPSTLQQAYRIIVRDETGRTVWDTGEVQSREQRFVEYCGETLLSAHHYRWTVEVRDNHGHSDEAASTFETGYLDPADWSARWITSTLLRPTQPRHEHGTQPPPVRFSRAFELSDGISRARLRATAYGCYRVTVNGARPDEREFAPEHTVYRSLLYYQTYDVTHLLKSGANELTFDVGDGWYFCPQTEPIMENPVSAPAVLFELVVEYLNGNRHVIASDGTETCSTGPVHYADLFWGEKLDLTTPFAPEQRVRVLDRDYSNLVAQPTPPVLPVKTIPAINVYVSPRGETIVDFGQVVAGRARIAIAAPAGAEIAFDYFETPDDEGNYFNSMIAGQKDIYVSDGSTRIYEAWFTYHGFRYVRVTGMAEVRKEDFTAVLLTTPKENRGSFECSDERLNRLYRNVRWSQANNMMSIPTDCPTREKAGFTGDIQLYAPTALLNEDMTAFLTAWLRNLAVDQLANGAVPMTVPYTRVYKDIADRMNLTMGEVESIGIAGWGDAVILVPYAMYLATGNRIVLRQMFEPMRAWCDHLLHIAHTRLGNSEEIDPRLDQFLFNAGFQFGEWLIPSQEPPNEDFDICQVSASYVAPFYAYRSIKTFAQISEILEEHDKSQHYGRLAEQMKHAIQEALMPKGRLLPRLMGAYVLAMAFGLVPEQYEDSFAEVLVEMIEARGRRLDTGFLATPHLLDALVLIGRRDLALALLWQDQQPSWLFQVDRGATTIWESWDALSEDGTPKVTSFDHYAFGCIDDWIARELAGIRSDPNRPGYQHVIIAPNPTEALTWLRRTHRSEYGDITVSWRGTDLDVTIPCNCTATVEWAGQRYDVGSGQHRFRNPPTLKQSAG